MKRRNPGLLIFGLVILSLFTLVFITWANHRYTAQNPGGSDLLARWVGTRLFLLEGKSPYSPEVSDEIQRQYYGRLARPDEDQVLFVYPLYSIFIFAPYALIPDFAMARAVWMTTLEVGLILLILASVSLNRWKLSPGMLAGLLIFSVLWYYSIRVLINANAAVLIALMIAGAFLAIRAGRDGLAGLLLAFSTIKPQMVAVLLAFMLLWAVSQRRWVLFWSILGNLVLLAALASLLLPNWIWQDMVQIVAYPDYTLPTTPGEMFTTWMPGVGKRMGQGLMVAMIVMLIFEWRAAWGKEFRWMLWTACLTITATHLIGIPTATENYTIMFPALIMVFAAWDEQWGALGRGLIFASYAGLLFGVWWLFLATLTRGAQPIQSSIMFFPLPVFLLIGLYWVRWWVLRPEQPLLDRIRLAQREP